MNIQVRQAASVVPRTREFWRKKQPVWNYRLQSEVIRNRRMKSTSVDILTGVCFNNDSWTEFYYMRVVALV